jgi:hypothetical protein
MRVWGKCTFLSITVRQHECYIRDCEHDTGLMVYDRFVCTPIPEVQKRLEREGEALNKEMGNLGKKEDYLEKTWTNSKNSLEQVLQGAR